VLCVVRLPSRQIGTIGLTQAAAVALYGADNLDIYTSTFVNMKYGLWQVGSCVCSMCVVVWHSYMRV
jgi:hypothetical protein